MTTPTAIEWYNRATGSNLGPSDLKPYTQEYQTICDIQVIAEMTERMGGELTSRQEIATIIRFSQLNWRSGQ